MSTNPLTGGPERFCAVTLNPRAFDWARQRPSLDLVVAVDISGSMAAPFEPADGTAASAPSKLDAVRDALAGVVERLDSTDRVGVVLFDTNASVLKPLQPLTETTDESLRCHLAGVVPAGNTNPMAGLRRAGALFDDATGRADTERRVVLVSDTVPTTDGASAGQYRDYCGAYRRRGVGISFVGLGFHDVGATRALCGEAGTNVAVAPDPAALAALCRRHLDSVLFPVALDLDIDVGPGAELTDVAAASDPSADDSAVHRETVFPAGPTAQSLDRVLLGLSAASDSADVRVTWTDRYGDSHERSLSVAYDRGPGEWFDTDSVRTDVALHRYLRGLQAWCRGDATDGARASAAPEPQSTRLARLRRYLVEERAATGVDQFDTDIEVLRAISGDS